MKKSGFVEEQLVPTLKQAAAGQPMLDMCGRKSAIASSHADGARFRA